MGEVPLHSFTVSQQRERLGFAATHSRAGCRGFPINKCAPAWEGHHDTHSLTFLPQG